MVVESCRRSPARQPISFVGPNRWLFFRDCLAYDNALDVHLGLGTSWRAAERRHCDVREEFNECEGDERLSWRRELVARSLGADDWCVGELVLALVIWLSEAI